MLESIITNLGNAITVEEALLCLATALGLGFVISLTYMFCGKYSSTFAVTLVLLPTLVSMVIMMVNGNLGTGIAIAGAFTLVRFRSMPGNAKDICTIFFSMAVGLATGMGYLVFAAIVTVALCLVLLVLSKLGFGLKNANERELKITIPENLDYTNAFDDLFETYTSKISLDSVKTTNLGSMYQLTYIIILKDMAKEKEFIDALRCRNGNLTIICGRPLINREEL